MLLLLYTENNWTGGSPAAKTALYSRIRPHQKPLSTVTTDSKRAVCAAGRIYMKPKKQKKEEKTPLWVCKACKQEVLTAIANGPHLTLTCKCGVETEINVKDFE